MSTATKYRYSTAKKWTKLPHPPHRLEMAILANGCAVSTSCASISYYIDSFDKSALLLFFLATARLDDVLESPLAMPE